MSEPIQVHMASKEVLPCFPTLVWVSRLSPQTHEPLNQRIRGKLDELTAGRPALEHGGMWQTEQDFDKAPGMEDLVRIIRGSVTGVLESLKVHYEGFDITGCWANISAPGAPHPTHTHPNNYLSGVYYVKTQPKANSIFFHDPRPQITIISPPPAELGPTNSGRVRLQAEAGTLIIFPSWLEHSVEPNQSDDVRISIAFNIMFTSFNETMSKPRWEGNVSTNQ